MTRPLLLSNGHLHVGINLYGMVHDFYYPWVGYENHARADKMRHRVGVWVENKFSWLDDGQWEFRMDYQGRTQIGHITAHNATLNVTLEFLDCVAEDDNIFVRNIHLINATDRVREIKLFMHQVFMIGASLNGDTGQFLPAEPAILHYKGRRAFIVGGKDQNGEPFSQHSIGLFSIEGHEGTYRDAEDGWLSMNEVEFGKVDSVIGFTAQVAAYESTHFDYWIACGKDQWRALDLHRKAQKGGVHQFYDHTVRHWHRWLAPAEKFLQHIDPELRVPFRKSLLITKSHIDHKGAVIASTDTTMLNYRRDSYAYTWPRDSTFALWPLVRMGYKNEPKKFFEFCRDVVSPDGYLLQKFRPDGAVGSSWLPYVISGRVIPPIQEDETANVVFLMGEYIEKHKDYELLQEYYEPFIKPAADFMAKYIDGATKLPQPSYDLWEEKFLTTTYTTATVFAALKAAVKMAEKLGRQQDAVHWQTVAEDMYEAAHRLLFNKERGYFYKGFVNDETKGMRYDATVDASSLYGAFVFGLFAADSEECRTSMATLETVFGFKPDKPTILQRYEYDQYYTADPAGFGNPWFVTTLWAAEYDMQIGNMARARTTINWVKDRMLSTGVLSEQVHPNDWTFASVAPLTWSQAEFVSSILDLQAKQNTINETTT
ncbi:MAG TPA: glycoside hydrolase family 15 protein [Candidatus Saccharimonadales bacterium]|nr:glycoside hydrolase family 15 protein [Candidatus Saccharimonadales bacterium]